MGYDIKIQLEHDSLHLETEEIARGLLRLEGLEGEQQDDQVEELVDALEGGITQRWSRWYDDFKRLSEEYPKVLFTVTAITEEFSEATVGYFRDGKGYSRPMEAPAFSPELLE